MSNEIILDGGPCYLCGRTHFPTDECPKHLVPDTPQNETAPQQGREALEAPQIPPCLSCGVSHAVGTLCYQPNETAAARCRREGWTPGTLLWMPDVGDYCYLLLEVTAIGRRDILYASRAHVDPCDDPFIAVLDWKDEYSLNRLKYARRVGHVDECVYCGKKRPLHYSGGNLESWCKATRPMFEARWEPVEDTPVFTPPDIEALARELAEESTC